MSAPVTEAAKPPDELGDDPNALRQALAKLQAEKEELARQLTDSTALYSGRRFRQVCAKDQLLEDDPNRFVPFTERREGLFGEDKLFTGIWQAKLRRGNWDGVSMLKSPFDMTILIEMLRVVQPKTVIELGSLAGGSALFLHDQARAIGLDKLHIISIDIDLTQLHPTAVRAALSPDLDFVEADCHDLSTSLTPEVLAGLRRPLVVLEDAHEALKESLAFFDAILQEGDYMVVEDTIAEEKMQEFANFMSTLPDDRYAVDTYLTDFWGDNVTWNPNAYLRRMR